MINYWSRKRITTLKCIAKKDELSLIFKSFDDKGQGKGNGETLSLVH